jgi:hypothetical protein
MMMTSLDQRFEHLTMGAVQSPEASTSDNTDSGTAPSQAA